MPTDACESLKTSVSEGKALIAAAVTDKGVNTAADASWETIANNIKSIVINKGYTKFTYSHNFNSIQWPLLSYTNRGTTSGTIYINDGKAECYATAPSNNPNKVFLTFS